MQAKKFLQIYRDEAQPLVQEFFGKWRQQAQTAGLVTKEVMERLADLYPRGKQLRGALTVLGYELAEGKNKVDILKASITIELLETSLLIADDVFDEDEKRRGILTVHKQWEKIFQEFNIQHRAKHGQGSGLKVSALSSKKYGQDMAHITSIIGFHLAPWLLMQTAFSEKIKTKALEFYCLSCVETVLGEALDISSPWQSFKDKQTSAQTIHDYKTVRYSAVLPLKFGALLAGAQDKDWLSNLEKYALVLGRVFQIQDDILGSFGNPKITGKANDNDIKGARWTILVELLWQKIDKKEKPFFRQIFEKTQKTDQDVRQVKTLMKKYKIVEAAQVRAEKFLREGLQVVPKITQNKKHQDTLENLLKFMLKRVK